MRLGSYSSVFLSTLSLRRATHAKNNYSTHTTNFYPRSPCGERQESQKPRHYARRFLSTLSLRRATGLCPAATPGWTISIHALLAESDLMVLVSIFSTASISIHALLAESDRQKQPVRHPAQISIHALLAESDAYFLQVQPRLHYFYPRSPCGERPGHHGGN